MTRMIPLVAVVVLALPLGSALGQGASPPRRTGAKRPWWDWLGVTQPKPKPVHQLTPPPEKKPWWDWLGATDPPQRPPAPFVKPERPWWDWLGVTEPKPKPMTLIMGGPNQPAKPWWDWLGVTDKKPPPPKTPKGDKPWWDWLGVTQKKPA